jgi:hypothetical protein
MSKLTRSDMVKGVFDWQKRHFYKPPWLTIWRDTFAERGVHKLLRNALKSSIAHQKQKSWTPLKIWYPPKPLSLLLVGYFATVKELFKTWVVEILRSFLNEKKVCQTVVHSLHKMWITVDTLCANETYTFCVSFCWIGNNCGGFSRLCDGGCLPPPLANSRVAVEWERATLR